MVAEFIARPAMFAGRDSLRAVDAWELGRDVPLWHRFRAFMEVRHGTPGGPAACELLRAAFVAAGHAGGGIMSDAAPRGRRGAGLA